MTAPGSEPRRQRIAGLAHAIWESEGRPEGQSVRHWAIAERLVQAEEHSRHGPAGQPAAAGSDATDAGPQ